MLSRISLLFYALTLYAPTTIPSQEFSQAHELLSLIRKTTKTPGLSAAVAINGRIVWSDAVGMADMEDGVRATPQSRFRVGSVSKILTVAALARLQDTGRIDIYAPVQHYVPTFPGKNGDITLLQLTGHLGGIRHYKDATEFLNQTRYESATDVLPVFQNDDLLFPPGSRYNYSSWGYVLVSAAIEQAVGQNFVAVVQTEVLDPLGMTATLVDDNQQTIPDRSANYDLDGGRIIASAGMDLSDRWASGGYLSTSEDLVRLGSAHLNDSWLKPETRTHLFTSQKTSDGKETGVGVGWRIDKDSWGRMFYHHAGSILGGRAMIAIFPESGVAVALTGNLGRAPFGKPEAKTLADLFIPHGLEAKDAVWDPEGLWQITRMTTGGPVTGVMSLTVEDGRISGDLKMVDQREMEIGWVHRKGNFLSVAAVDPVGQLEILWLQGSGDTIEGSTWRRQGDFRAERLR